MKIRALHVEHFRKFVEPVSLTGLGDGVNVLAECNEFGKSTLLAAIRGVLFERFSSKAQSVQAMRHWVNRTAPKIKLEFELHGRVYKIEKRFLDKAYAELILPDGTKHSNDAAEEYLQNLLHFNRAGKSGSKPEDIGMWGALWVSQRDSVDQPKLHDSARRTIQECLDREVGSLAGGTRGAALLNAVRLEIAALRNGVQKPTGRYKDALTDLEKAASQVEELTRKLGDLTKDIAELANVDRELAQAATSGEDARLEVDLTEAKRKKEAAQRYEDQEQRAKADYELVQSRMGDLEATAEQRAVLGRQKAEAALKVTSALASAGEATRSREIAANALAGQNELVRLAQTACDSAQQELREARALADLARQSEALELLRARLADAEKAQQSVNSLGARLLAATITEEQVKTIEDSITSLDRVRAVLDAQATLVTLNVLENAKARLHVNGMTDWSATELRVIEDLVLDLEGIGSIMIRPGIRDREAQLGRQAEAERALRNSLNAAQVTTLADARAKLLERQNWERDLAAAKKEVVKLTPMDATNKVGAGIQPLKDRVSVVSAALQAELTKRSMAAVPLIDAALTMLLDMEQVERQLSDELSVARAPLAQLQKSRDAAVTEEANAQAAFANARHRSEELVAEHQQSLQRESDEALASRRATVAANVLVKRGLLEQLQRDKPPDSVAGMETRIKRFEEAKLQFNRELNKRKQDKAVLESRIEREAGIGIDEQLEEARRNQETLEQEIARFTHELAVLDLLRKTLEDAEREAKERYMAPVVQRMLPYLQRLFPKATIRCDENFNVTGILRTAEENFDGLSDGTQEQIAVLTRLAFADMLIDSNHPAMLVLDDALAYSDNARIETMFDMLTEASSRIQILVLTCREDAFRRLGGTRIRVEHWDNQVSIGSAK
jgi:hypothetical protein